MICRSVTQNEYTVSSSYSFNGNGNNPLGRGERKRPELFIEESRNVLLQTCFLLIRAAASISKIGFVSGELKNVYSQIKFRFLLNNYFLSTPLPLSHEAHLFPNQPPGLPEHIAWKQFWVLSKSNYKPFFQLIIFYVFWESFQFYVYWDSIRSCVFWASFQFCVYWSDVIWESTE